MEAPSKPYVGDRPFAYIDDDIGRDAEAWAATRPAPTLLLAIKGDRGLLAPDVEELLHNVSRRTNRGVRGGVSRSRP